MLKFNKSSEKIVYVTPPEPVAKWVRENAAANPFAASLFTRLHTSSKLSPKQIAAVEKNLQPKVVMSVGVEGTGKMEAAFASAKAHGLKKPSMTIEGYRFKPAPTYSVNAGAIYVTKYQGSHDYYLGKIRDGGFTGTHECTDVDRAIIGIICNDPFGGAVNYGKLTGNCACCGKALSDPKSVELGIGPVCKKKFGW